MIKKECIIVINNQENWIKIQECMFQQNIGWRDGENLVLYDSESLMKTYGFPRYIKINKPGVYNHYYMTFGMDITLFDDFKKLKIIEDNIILRKYKLKKLSI